MSLKEVFKKHYKTILISGFVGGFIYALGMAGFEFLSYDDIDVSYIIYNFICFGIFSSFMSYFNLKHKSKV
ncbi:hypothetical protein [Croceibacter atlanticus]|jgi:hypothetical protein|uniref:hypothetical protein n=1 Tax=Croceibacter atlanticus TaxID=313588 RepID=UPI002490B6E8|nr:hypothetical protein [Croceibacter atlanticus]WSP34199.1 hypothetical protein VVL01_12400 [Croceibacter atlanticus]